MTPEAFLQLVEDLTGTPAKDITERDRTSLASRLDDEQAIDCSELNELLLLVNKDRIEQPFFQHFFPPPCKVRDLTKGVRRFQAAAMLEYGNFIYAFRKLSKIRDIALLAHALGEHGRKSEVLIEKFKSRKAPILQTTPISRDDTYLVGYLSAGEIIADTERAELLRRISSTSPSWEATIEAARAATNSREHPILVGIIGDYQLFSPGATPQEFGEHLATKALDLAERRKHLEQVRQVAIANQDVYLTWDHMDIYFATSMRKRWEYEDLFDFIAATMGNESLTELNLRCFDPTQAYTNNRINKGLVEALMLRRARCTVYSVQDTDTLGKDSELAATLAQGKPVIAYVPQIDVAARAAQLLSESPSTVQERLRFILYMEKLANEDYEFLRSFVPLDSYDLKRRWRSLPDDHDAAAFLEANRPAMERTCGIIAAAEARIYDKRHDTLRDSHPLGIQVHLDTGVANGVLVVRSAEKCAKLLRSILTNAMSFTVENSEKDGMWYLREDLTGCIFRVVTKDRKLTNCFWNFYLRKPDNHEGIT